MSDDHTKMLDILDNFFDTFIHFASKKLITVSGYKTSKIGEKARYVSYFLLKRLEMEAMQKL